MSTNRRNPLEPVEEAADLLARRKKAPTAKRDRSWDAQRSKATYDLPPQLIERIRQISDELTDAYPDAKVRLSDVARLLLEAGLDEYEAGNLSVKLKPVSFVIFDD